MREIIKYVWLLLFVIFLMGLIALIPYNKYQAAYFNRIYSIRAVPQQRVDATYRYIEAVENGWEDTSNGILTEPPKKYYLPLGQQEVSKKVSDKKFAKPRYIRDKNNPNIYYRYLGN